MDLLVWMEFREPKPAEVVERLDANGVEKILNFFGFTTLVSQTRPPRLLST